MSHSIKAALLFFAVAICALLVVPAPAKADTVYTDLGTGYNCCTGFTISGPTSIVGVPFDAASEFASSGNYAVAQIDLGLGFVSGTNGATVELTTDNGGNPGTVLGTWSVSSLPTFGSSSTTLTTISGITGVDISAGNYFLEVLPGASNTWDAWNWNNSGATGSAGYFDGTSWTTTGGTILPAFDVLGVPGSPVATPEPSSLLMLGCGLLALMAIAWRRSSQAAGRSVLS